MSALMLGLILLTVTLSACAQLALKLGVSTPSMVSGIETGGRALLLAALSSPLIWMGLAMYGLSMLLWLWVLAKVELSLAYPFVGISFVMTMGFGALILNELVTPMRIVGTMMIVTGCVLVARTA